MLYGQITVLLQSYITKTVIAGNYVTSIEIVTVSISTFLEIL